MTKRLSTKISNVTTSFAGCFPSLYYAKPHRKIVTSFAFQRKSWKWLCVFLIILFPGISRSQLQFTTNDLPCQIGQYNCSYFSTNVDVSGYLTLSTNNPFPIGNGSPPEAQIW